MSLRCLWASLVWSWEAADMHRLTNKVYPTSLVSQANMGSYGPFYSHDQGMTEDFLWGHIDNTNDKYQMLHCIMQKKETIEHTNAKFHVYMLMVNLLTTM